MMASQFPCWCRRRPQLRFDWTAQLVLLFHLLVECRVYTLSLLRVTFISYHFHKIKHSITWLTTTLSSSTILSLSFSILSVAESVSLISLTSMTSVEPHGLQGAHGGHGLHGTHGGQGVQGSHGEQGAHGTHGAHGGQGLHETHFDFFSDSSSFDSLFTTGVGLDLQQC